MRRRALFVVLFVVSGLVALMSSANPSGAQSTAVARQDTSPVDLATPIDMAAGMAHRSAIVHVGDVRIEVLTPACSGSSTPPSQHFENRPDGERPRPADAGPSVLRLHRGGLADRPHGERHPALQAGVGTVHPAQHLAPTVGRRPEIHGGADVGMGVHLRPGVPGRRGHPGRGRRPQPDLSRVREHRRLRGVLRQARSQRHLARHRFDGGSGGGLPALLQRGEPSAGTGPEHARPGRRTVGCDRSSTPLPRRRPSPGRRSPPPFR